MKQRLKTNFRVVVTPKLAGGEGLEYERKCKRRCEEIVSQIQRHADNVDRVLYDFDYKDVCGLCGDDWVELKNGAPACCEAAMQEWRATK